LRAWDRFPDVDTLIVTSRETVRRFVARPVVLRRLRRLNRLQVVSVGPRTGGALRRVGLLPSYSARTGGSRSVLEHLASLPARRVLYPRSDRAGPRLARALAGHGHRVLDLPVYRVRAAVSAPVAWSRLLLRADLIVFTSPSAMSHLRRSLPVTTFHDLRRRPHLVVLGERSARAARGHGFAGVRVAPSTDAQRFTRFLLAEVHRGS
jgi:uroporphyrinogen-III synthase